MRDSGEDNDSTNGSPVLQISDQSEAVERKGLGPETGHRTSERPPATSGGHQSVTENTP